MNIETARANMQRVVAECRAQKFLATANFFNETLLLDSHKIVTLAGMIWPEDESEKPMALNDRETATVLHALRMVQCEGRIEGCNAADCDHFADCEALTNDEIDSLCERLNFYDVAALPPRR